METSQNIIESERHGGGGGVSSGDEAVASAPQSEQLGRLEGSPHSHTHALPPPPSISSNSNGSVDPSAAAALRQSSPELCPSQPPPMDHLNDESTGSGVTSLGDSNESSTQHHHMDDSRGTAMLSNEKAVGDHHHHDMEGEDEDDDDEEVDDEDDTMEDHDVDEEEELVAADASEEQETTAVVASKAPASKKEPATKRFKCLHCSKSYVREFQLNTHVRKYHPEKPVKPQDTSAAAATTAPAWTQADMDEALESLKTERMSLVKASQHHGIPASTLWQRATRLGIMIPKNMTRTSSKDGVADAVQLLKTGQISVNKASKVFGIPPSTLYKIAKREGIQLSSPFNSATTSWTQENLQLAMDAIRTGQMSVHMASVEFKIPPGTLYGRCKREGLELSRNNPVQWSPRDLKNALEAVKTGQMSINQASEHYKISYSSLYKRVKPHFVNNNNNNSSNSNQNLAKMGNELGETDLQGGGVGGGVGGLGVIGGPGMDVVQMHHPMDYDTHRGLPTHHSQQQQQPIPPQVQQQPTNTTGVNYHQQMQMQYGNSGQQQSPIPQQQHSHQQQSHYGQPQIHQQQPHPHHHQQQQQSHASHYGQQQQQIIQNAHPTSLPAHQQHPHHPQNHPSHYGQQISGHPHQAPATMHHYPVAGQDDRVGYPCNDADKHGLTSSSGIGLNGLMGISMGFLDFAPDLPAPVAVPVTEHYSSPPPPQTAAQQQSPYSSVITKDNSSAAAAAASRHPPNSNSSSSNNNGHYNNNGASSTASSAASPGIPQSNPNHNGYATLQNNYYHHHSVIHSPVHHQQQQQQQNHHNYGHHHHGHHPQQHHHQQQQQQSPHLQMSPHLSNLHAGLPHQRHGMVPLNEDKLLLMQKEGRGVSLIDPHAATADYEEKVMVTTINDL